MEEIIRLVNRAQEMNEKRIADQEAISSNDPEWSYKRKALAYQTLGGYEYFIREIGIFARLAMEENPS